MQYNKRRRGRKRSNYRKGGKGGRRYAVKKRNNMGTLIADRTKVMLKYAEDINVTVDGSIGANYLFRCNSLYDPNQSGVGHQPMGRDQYANFYKRYVVIGSKITVRFIAQEGNTATNSPDDTTNVGITTIADTSDTIIQPTEFMENNRTTYGVITPSKPIHTITKYFSPKTYFGFNKVVDEEDVGAYFGTNPVNTALWQLKFWPTATGVTRTVSANVMIQYICILRERVNIGGS